MTQRLRFVLDGDDQLTPALNHAGDSSARLHRRLNDDMAGNSRAVRQFTQDANGRLRDLNGRFVSAADSARMMGDGMPMVVRRLGDVADAGGDAAASLGKGSGGLGGALTGVAAVAGLSLLPALGALVPMMAGAALAAGTMKLGFAGVGDALEAQTKGTKEYNEALEKLPKPARAFTKELVSLKKEFGGVGKDIQKAMLPGFTKALKEAGPVVKIVGDGMTKLGGQFGKAAEGVGKLFKNGGFQKDLQTNLDLGRQFVGDMMTGVGKLGRSFLDFGAASEPTLTALSGGLRDLLGEGMPGMFDGLKTGIEGSSKFLDGFFSMINDLLPAIGRFSGEVARTFGPLLGELMTGFGERGGRGLDFFGKAVRGLMPVFKDLGFGMRAITDVLRLVGPTIADVGSAIVGSLIPNFGKIEEAKGPLQRLSDAINNNKGAIQEFARQAGGAFLDIAGFAIQMAPTVIGGFRLMAMGSLTALDGLVSGAAHAFGWIPGTGPKLKAANRQFDTFKGKFLDGLGAAKAKAEEFAAAAGPRLAAGKLKLDINNWQSQIESAKAKLKTVPPSKQSSLKATIADLQAKVRRAKGDLASIPGSRTVTITTNYVKNYLTGRSQHDITGATGGLYTGSGFAHRGRGYKAGGLVEGPGTETSDDVSAPWLSKNEFVVNAAQTRRHLPLLKALNAGLVPAGGMAGAGLAAGMTGSTGVVMAGARQMAAAVTAGVKAELEIASPSRKMTALAKDIGKGLIKGLTGSRDKIKATAADLAKDIRSAFSGRKESSLIKSLDRQTKKLLDLAAKRDKVAATIAAAKDYRKDVTTGARDGAGLSNLGMSAEEVTAGGIKAGLAGKLAQIRQFTRYIGMLAKRGLSKDLLRQILNMGPDAGYAYASALAGADKATFASINSLQKQIGQGADKLGATGADILYDSGKNAGKGFLTGLSSQQKAIEAQMLKIAKGMDKAIRKALGIKSPSTVMAQLGVYSTHGLARGLVDGVPVLDRALDTVTGRVAGTQPVMGRAAAIGGGGGTVTVNITIQGATDPTATAREVERVLARYKRGRGGAAYGFG